MRKFTRRVAKPTTWQTNSASYVGNVNTAVPANTLTAFILVDTIAAGVVPNVERFTVQRIVGEMVVENNAAAAAATDFSMGICLVTATNGADTVALDPRNQLDSEAGWLWLCHGRLQGVAAGSPEQTNQQILPRGAHIDIKVKRIVHSNMVLKLMFAANGATLVYPNLRTLLSRVA